jgi:hypothetical protein
MLQIVLNGDIRWCVTAEYTVQLAVPSGIGVSCCSQPHPRVSADRVWVYGCARRTDMPDSSPLVVLLAPNGE